MMGETVECAAISPHTYILFNIQVQCYLQHSDFRDFINGDVLLVSLHGNDFSGTNSTLLSQGSTTVAQWAAMTVEFLKLTDRQTNTPLARERWCFRWRVSRATDGPLWWRWSHQCRWWGPLSQQTGGTDTWTSPPTRRNPFCNRKTSHVYAQKMSYGNKRKGQLNWWVNWETKRTLSLQRKCDSNKTKRYASMHTTPPQPPPLPPNTHILSLSLSWQWDWTKKVFKKKKGFPGRFERTEVQLDGQKPEAGSR